MIEVSCNGNLGFFNLSYIRTNLGCTCNPSYITDDGINVIFNAFGYIPVIGIFIGVGRIKLTEAAHSYIDENIGAFRGVCEILGIGILFLLIDLIVTLAIYIHCKLKHRMSEEI